ncbi:MAG: hypothetical protein OXT67_13835 [Zetaproteobacteria bacterium]|nr:hypothetical protein [Zetaproteobacteria bacterium]
MKPENPCKLMIAVAALNTYLPSVDAAVENKSNPIVRENFSGLSGYGEYVQELVTKSQSLHDQRHTKEHYKDHSKDHNKVAG